MTYLTELGVYLWRQALVQCMTIWNDQPAFFPLDYPRCISAEQTGSSSYLAVFRFSH